MQPQMNREQQGQQGQQRAIAGGAMQSNPRRFQLKLRKHTGMLVIMRSQTFVVTGSLEECEAAYRRAQTHNFVAGWWGVFSFLFMNWIAILGNRSAIAELRRIAAAPAAPRLA
jgi:hypothetical protein